ncbi:MAG TPA: MazG-like family protein [Candidatus Jeotgalibaca merdavium]|uniref:MazG-like family protein n=1 Tax=Candidatus Jeotgalibaca merdavium TaxID=2838627 RepID=A0A9D2I307_9LACT|nr:MazG-like family protein [Candidatus Jeotgalibaca merdavium]
MMQHLTELIRQWAEERNLQNAKANKQVIKLGEEFGELCQGMAKDNAVQVYDSIGDMYVVLTILCMQLGISIEQCVSYAYDEIKDRKGKMVNGVFVKEEDLARERKPMPHEEREMK